MYRILLFIFLMFLVLRGQGSLSPDSVSGEDSKGLKYYESILKKYPDMAEARYGAGHSAYVMGNYDRALTEFESVLNSDNTKLKSKSYYNIGNTLHNQGRLEESLQAYRNALELDPTDLDTKYNYEFTKQLMQQMQDQQQKQQSEQSERKQEPEQQTQEHQSQEEKESENQSQQNQSPSSNSDKEEQREQQPTQQEQAAEDKVKPDAESILNALKAHEQNLMKRRFGLTESKKLEKDW